MATLLSRSDFEIEEEDDTSDWFTAGQDDAFSAITTCRGVKVIQGYAGTGKTTVVAAAVRSYPDSFVVCAPTHKALRQLREKMPPKTEMYTLASLLMKKKKRDQQGGWTFECSLSEEELRKARCAVLLDKVLIVDECSMLSQKDEKLLRCFLDKGPSFEYYKEGRDVEQVCRGIVFVGDNRQLPPVEEEQTKLMADSEPRAVKLMEVVRHDGAILELATALRSVPFGSVPLGKYLAPGEVTLTNNEDRWTRAWLARLHEDEDAKVLAFTNKRVAQMNSLARTSIYGVWDEDEYERPPMEDEMFLTVEASTDKEGTLQFPSTTEIRVRKIEEIGVSCYIDGKLDMTLAWRIEAYAPAMGIDGAITVVQSRDEDHYKATAKKLKSAALKERSLWSNYYRYVEAFTWIQPAYALTIHKSQGSTYDHVFLDMADIDRHTFRDRVMQNRLLYVGVTRAAQSVHLFG